MTKTKSPRGNAGDTDLDYVRNLLTRTNGVKLRIGAGRGSQ